PLSGRGTDAGLGLFRGRDLQSAADDQPGIEFAGQMKDAVCPGLLETDQRPGSSNQAGHSPGKNPRPTATNDGFYREENGSDKKHPFCISLLGYTHKCATD